MHPVGKKNNHPTSPVAAASTGKLPEVKRMHEARMGALAALTGALLEIYKGDADAAAITADELLRRVSVPELDLTGLTVTEANLVPRMPAGAWKALQQYAQASNEAGITSVSLSSKVVVSPTLVHGLAQLHLQHLALGRPVIGMALVRLQASLPFLEHISQRWAATNPPEYEALLRQPTADAPEPVARSANRPPPTARKLRNRGLAQSVAPNDRMLQTRLNQAMEGGDVRRTRAAVSAILRAELGPRLRLELLLSQVAPEAATPAAQRPVRIWGTQKIFVPALTAFVEDMADGQAPEQTATPVLGRLCGQLGRPQQVLPHPRYEVVSAYLEEILNSTLPAQDKATICASAISTPQGILTAARLAMQEGHPLAVAKMMLAILESDAKPADKLEMIASLEVSKEEIDAALSMPELQGIPQVDTLNRLWTDCWAALPLMAGDARVTLESSASPTPVVMRVERMWVKGSGQVLCLAPQAIPELQSQRLNDRFLGLASRFCYAVDPALLVKHTPGTTVVQESRDRPAP